MGKAGAFCNEINVGTIRFHGSGRFKKTFFASLVASFSKTFFTPLAKPLGQSLSQPLLASFFPSHPGGVKDATP